MSLPPARPRAVDGAFVGAITGAALACALLGLSGRPLGHLGVGAALAALALAVPMRAGHPWARAGLFACALVGVLCGPSAANTAGWAAAVALVAVWVVVLACLARPDVRAYVAVRDMRG